jgi:hypothetical protein
MQLSLGRIQYPHAGISSQTSIYWRIFSKATTSPQKGQAMAESYVSSDMSGVTVVLTSCGRQDLLERTLDSFFKFNTYPIDRVIVVEDGPGERNALLMRKYHPRDITWIDTGQRIGQIAAIDYAYPLVTTETIFHLEDDWEFYEPNFIEKSLLVLRADPSCLQVWLRALADTNGHPLSDEIENVGGTDVRRLLFGYLGKWHGFSFNPGLRRTADYRQLASYGRHICSHVSGQHAAAEVELSRIYHELGMHAVILADNDGRGYVRHIGSGRQVERDRSELPTVQIERQGGAVHAGQLAIVVRQGSTLSESEILRFRLAAAERNLSGLRVERILTQNETVDLRQRMAGLRLELDQVVGAKENMEAKTALLEEKLEQTRALVASLEASICWRIAASVRMLRRLLESLIQVVAGRSQRNWLN